MNILTKHILGKIQNTLIEHIIQENIEDASDAIKETLTELYNAIPENKRISYGTYYTIRILSKQLYDELTAKTQSLYQKISPLFSFREDYKVSCVCLGILSWHAIEKKDHIKKIIPFFKQSAIDESWIMRETAAGLFQKMIKKYPKEIKPYLQQFSTNPHPYLRRFVSETLRPVAENQWIQKQPEYSLSILRNMFTESSAYPRTSVGNNLSDLARRNPELIYTIVEKLVQSGNKQSYWIATRACRNLIKKEPLRVLNLLNTDEYKYKKTVVRRKDILI